MRIAYVSLHWPRTYKEGVGRKIFEQLHAWQSAGHTAKLFMHTSTSQSNADLLIGEHHHFKTTKGPVGLIKTEVERIQAASHLIEGLRRFGPELIYLRYGIYVYPIHRLKLLAPTIEEINTNDVSQHKDLGIIYDIYNRATRGVLLKNVSGLVCVSDELARTREFMKYHKPTEVIANGIDMSSIATAPAPMNTVPRLIFIATPGYYWHGVDKIVKLADRYPDLHIFIIGYTELNLRERIPNNLNCLGYLEAADYKNVLAEADLALGTMALHRKSMNEASPLKTRECLAHGLPMVLPYMDTDLDNLDCDFLLKIPNREDNIETHGEAIHEFAYHMRGKRADRSLLINRIDSKDKEKARLEFFNQIAKGALN